MTILVNTYYIPKTYGRSKLISETGSLNIIWWSRDCLFEYFYKCFLISTHFSYFRHACQYSQRPELLYILDKRIPCYRKVVGRAACNFRDTLEDIHHNILLHLLCDISSNRNRYYHPERNFKHRVKRMMKTAFSKPINY